jgi:hypothetical protein
MQHAELQVIIAINRWLWVALIIAQTALIVRLFLERLVRRYPVFTTYLILDLIIGVVLLLAAARTLRYLELYRASLVASGILRVGVVCELYNRICDHFPGIGAFRLRVAGALVFVGALLAFVSIPAIAAQWGHSKQAMFQITFMIMTQYENEIIALLLAGIWLFFHLLKVTPQYRRNLLIHWRIATLYFLVSGAHALAILWTGIGETVHPINTAMLVADLVLVVAWTALLNRRGEELPEVRRLSPAELEALERKDAALTRFITQLPRQIATHLK